jgi:hypothetical protein
MTQHLEYSEVVVTTPDDVWDSWFEDTHEEESEDNDIPEYDSMVDKDE